MPWRTSRGSGPGARGHRHGGAQAPDEERHDDPPRPGPAAPRHTSAQPADHSESHGARPPGGRTGVCWAGARAEAGGRDPQGTRGPIRWPTTASGKTARDTVSQVEPGAHEQRQPHPAPRAPDTRRSRPEAPSSKTSSLRHSLQGRPRHARQPKPRRQPCRPLPRAKTSQPIE